MEQPIRDWTLAARAGRWTCALLLAGVFTAHGATYHVAPNGNDAASGLAGAPWRTLIKAAATAAAGDTVLIGNGVYTGAVTFTRSGTAAAPIVFQNEPGETPIIDGTGAGVNKLLHLSGVAYVKLMGLTARNAPGDGVFIGGAAHHIDLRNLEVFNSGSSGVWIQTTGTTPTFITVKGSRLHDNAKGGVTVWLSPGGYILIEGNRVYNNVGTGNFDGIQVGGGDGSSHHVVVRGNVAYGNGQSGDGPDQIDLGGHAFGDYFLVEDNDARGPGGDFKVQQGFGGTTMICRRNRLTRTGFAIYYYPSPTVFYSNTVVGATHAIQFWSDTAAALPGLSLGGFESRNNLLLQEAGDYLFLLNGVPGFHIDVRYSSMRLATNVYRFSTKGILWSPRIFNTADPTIGAAEFAAYQGANAPDFQDAGSRRTTVPASSIFVDPVALDYHLKAGSPAIDAGGPLTTTTAGGTNATVIPVVRPTYFQDGWDGLSAPDTIRVGANAPVTVTRVNEANKTITVATPITWASGDAVSLPYSGSAPDAGAFEYGAALEKPVLLDVQPIP